MAEERKETNRVFRYFDWIMALFVTVLIISNIASSAKIVDWGFSISGLRFAFDAGTILFPVSYIFGDVLTEVYGFKKSRRVIWTGFAMLALSALVLWLVRLMPGEGTWGGDAGEGATDALLFGVFPWELFGTLAVTNYIFKVGIEVLMTPVTYRIVNALKRAEKEDYYDTQTRFTPFAID